MVPGSRHARPRPTCALASMTPATVHDTIERPGTGAVMRRHLEPVWLRTLALAPAAAAVAFGVAGLALALAGSYRPSIAYALGAGVTVALLLLARPALRVPGRNDPVANACALTGIAICVAIGAWNVVDSGEHVLINRDPGVYVNAGRWIASNGDLRVPPAPQAVTEVDGVTQHSFGVYVGDGGHLEFQFAHLLPVLLAEAHRIGGDRLMFALPAVLSSAALLAFFVLVWRFTRVPWLALVATATLGLMLPQVAFSRDTYSEIPTQLLAFTVAWLLMEGPAVRDARTMLLAGVLAGSLQAVRIDALVMLVGIPFAFAAWWLAADGERRPQVLRGALAFAGGALVGLAVGLVDLVLRSGDYFRDLSGELRALLFAGGGSLVAASAIAAFGWRAPTLLAKGARLTARVAPWVVLSLGMFAWLLRPRLEQIHGAPSPFIEGLQRAEGVPPDGTLQYYDHSFDWMAWYHGRVGVVLAIVGAALVTRQLFGTRALHLLAPLALLAPASALYLWRAQAFQDHVWVMRRLLIGAIPLFVICAAALLAWSAHRGKAGRILAVAAAVLVVGAPLSSLRGVARMSEQPGYTRAIKEACGAFGPRAAVIVLEGDGLLHEWIPQTLRSWCGSDVVILRGTADVDVVRELGRVWGSAGRPIWLVADTPDTLLAAAPGAQVSVTTLIVNERELERTLTHRPRHYVRAEFAFAFAPHVVRS